MHRWVVLLSSLAVVVAGCASSDGEEDSEAALAASPPVDVTVVEGDAGVTVSQDTSAPPEIDLPGGDPPDQLVVDVVVEGDGDTVVPGDLLRVDYTGVLWDTGEQFDSSWDRGTPAEFGIGIGAVIGGWDGGLVGRDVGDRVLLVIPPELGYGAQGTPGGIPGGATLVFVVDIRGTYGARDDITATPVDDLPTGLPVVDGDPGVPPSIDVSGAEEPDESTSVVVAEGEGEVLDGDVVVVHAVQAPLDTGEVQFSTWDAAPEAISPDALPGLAEALDGARVGTRALTLIAAEDNDGEAIVLVLDVLGGY